MTKEIHDINARALDFVVELIEYIFEYPDDDYMTMECLCRKLHKYGLVDKKDGYYLVADDTLRKTESDSEIPNNFDKDINVRSKDEPQTDIGIGCSRCGVRFGCIARDMPHAVHCNSYGKITDEP